MSGLQQFWDQGDAITRCVAALLLVMSVSAWADPGSALSGSSMGVLGSIGGVVSVTVAV